MKRSRAQLNAISRSYNTEKARLEAIRELACEHGVGFFTYRDMFSYKGSPVRLLTSIREGNSRTLYNLEIYRRKQNESRISD